MEKRSLRIQVSDGEEKMSYLTIGDPKEQVTKGEVQSFVSYIISNGLVKPKDSPIKEMVSATLVTKTEREL